MDPLNHAMARTTVVPSGRAQHPTSAAQAATPQVAAVSTHGGATIMSGDAGQAPADVRLPFLRQALSNVGTTAAALVDISAELRQAGVPGLAWDSDYLADQVDALAGAIALLVKATEEQTGTTGPTDQGEAERPRQTD